MGAALAGGPPLDYLFAEALAPSLTQLRILCADLQQLPPAMLTGLPKVLIWQSRWPRRP